jgi:hypothetical protein
VMTRYYGWYASRTRGTRARLARLASDGRRLTAEGISVEEPVAITEPVNWYLRAARRSSPASSCTGPGASNAPGYRLPASGFRLLPAPTHRPATSLTRRRPGRIFGSARRKLLSIARRLVKSRSQCEKG